MLHNAYPRTISSHDRRLDHAASFASERAHNHDPGWCVVRDTISGEILAARQAYAEREGYAILASGVSFTRSA